MSENTKEIIDTNTLIENLEKDIKDGEPMTTEGLGFPLTVILLAGEFEFRGQHRCFEDENGHPIIEFPHEIRICVGMGQDDKNETIAHEVFHLFYSIRKLITVDEETEAEIFGELVRHIHRFIDYNEIIQKNIPPVEDGASSEGKPGEESSSLLPSEGVVL